MTGWRMLERLRGRWRFDLNNEKFEDFEDF